MFSRLSAAIGAIRRARRYSRMTRDELETARLGDFREFAAFVRANSPYYADIMAERGLDPATCRPEDFPPLTKKLLMENFDRIVTDRRITKAGVSAFLERSKDPKDLFLGAYRVMHTSGTSGEVGYFLFSPEDWVRGTFGMVGRSRRRQSLLKNRKGRGRLRMAFFGATGGHFAGATMVTVAGSGLMGLFVRARAFEINAPMAGTISGLNAFQPDMLSGYTTALRMLADRQRAGELRISPVAIAATGETASPEDLEYLSDAFGGADAVSAYGCTEHLGMGGSDPGGKSMTLVDGQLIFEPHEDHTLVTNLFNRTVPLIRYRMNDIIKPVGVADDGPWLKIENLVGRTELTPVFTRADGTEDFVSPHIINEIIVPGVARFQLRLTGPASFRFLAMTEPGLGAEGIEKARQGLKGTLEEILAQKGLQDVGFNVEIVDEIPVDPRTRKFRLIVDERR